MYKRNGIYYADFIHDGQRYVKSLKVSSKSVARELEQKFKIEVLTGKYAEKQERKKRDVGFAIVLKEYIENVAKVDKKSWKRDLVSERHLKKFFKKKKFLAITSDDVIHYKNARQKEIMNQDKNKEKEKSEITFTTINRELALLKRLYNWYAEMKKIEIKNPVKGIKYFQEKSRERVMTLDEEKRFFTNGKPAAHMRYIVLFALYTGMRRSEIFKLKKKHVFLGDLGGYILLKDTKNGEDRKVPLNKDLTKIMREIIYKVSDDDYIFTNYDGSRIKDIKKAWQGACDRAGIKDLRFHDLRHTFCTRAAQRGTNPFFIMKIVGHKDPKTAQRYTNPTDEHLLNVMPVLESHQNPQQLNQEEVKEVKTQGKSIRACSSVG